MAQPLDAMNKMQSYQSKQQDFDSTYQDLMSTLKTLQTVVSNGNAGALSTVSMQEYPGQQFTGSGVLQVSSMANVQACEDQCTSMDNCSGGTFAAGSSPNAATGMCTLATGNGMLGSAAGNDTTTSTAFVKSTTTLANQFQGAEAAVTTAEQEIRADLWRWAESIPEFDQKAYNKIQERLDRDQKIRLEKKRQVHEIMDKVTTTNREYDVTFAAVEESHSEYSMWLMMGVGAAVFAGGSVLYVMSQRAVES